METTTAPKKKNKRTNKLMKDKRKEIRRKKRKKAYLNPVRRYSMEKSIINRV
jgi:hypothetical protein